MVHDAQGWWMREAGQVEPYAPLRGDISADVVIVGGGFTGLWTAWFVKALEPAAEVALVEREVCGSGPSGRNAGFVNEMWFSLPALCERFGDSAALALTRAASEAVVGVGRWCEENEVDAWYRRAGYLQVATNETQEKVRGPVARACRELGVPEACQPLDARGVAERCASPLFGGGAYYPGAATVQPARLAQGLRQRVADRGVRVFERSPARSVAEGLGEVTVRTDSGSVRASRAVLGAGPWLGGMRPFRRALTLTSSHMVITEPVSNLLEEIGWTGGECITDARAMLHYFRTTPDGRIAFGWGAGKVVPAARLGDRVDVDRALAEQVAAHLRRFFPGLEGRRIEHAWGGPIDVSATHLPVVTPTPGGRAWAAFGYTGNGVGPSHLVGSVLAPLVLDRRDDPTRLPIVDPPVVKVPPEPLRWVGGTIVRSALLRKETAEEHDREPDPLSAFIARLPERIGIHIGR